MSSSKRTPLYDLHVSLGAKMVDFAGYAMPVQYPAGILAEHRHTRAAAGLFDISHMGQIMLQGQEPLKQIEKIMPGDFQELAPGQMRYSFLLNESGGVIDDLMVTRKEDPSKVFLVVNASGREEDFAHIQQQLPGLKAEMLDDRAMLALQGPKASEVLARFCDAPAKLKFMHAGNFSIDGVGECFISRSGYTGEDGFEISVPATTAATFARDLLAHPEVAPAGLGARDSLRLEAGLCLYGHDLDPQTTPVEANLVWAIGKRRRKEGGFTGSDKILAQLAKGVARKRVGIRPEGRALAREHTEIADDSGRTIGIVTSGGFGASVDGPVAMGYLETGFSAPGSRVFLKVRGQALPGVVTALPFVPHKYWKG